MNICALKAAEQLRLPAIVAFDGFFTSHQKRKCSVFSNDEDVRDFLGKYEPKYSALDVEHPVSIGSYMNEPDIVNNKYQLHLAMERALKDIPQIFSDYEILSGRRYDMAESYMTERRRSGAVPPRLKLPYSQRGSGQAEKRRQEGGRVHGKRSQTISKGHVITLL